METGIAQSKSSKSAITQSRPLSSDALVAKLGMLMGQAQSFFPNQTLPEGTPDVWLKAWEEMVGEMGLQRFEAALWRALRTGNFIPSPEDIDRCDSELRKIAAAKRSEDMDERRRQERINAEAHRKAHPEDYFSVKEAVDQLLKSKFGASRTEAK